MTSQPSDPYGLSNFFSGKTVVITGAGRGIGRAAAQLLAAHGARVVIAEIDSQGAQCASEIELAHGQAQFFQTDVSDPGAVQQLAQQTQAAYGPADVLINNAILSPTGSVLEMEVELWDRVMAVNLRGTFLTCKFFLPGMLSRGQGVIVNMISTEALPHMSAYMASKQGIAAFSRSLAGEVGDQGIQVLAFAPGFVDTPGLRAAARGLAPHMQLDEEAFMNLSFHPAYTGAMPVADAALATALLINRYREHYHGEQVDGYTILERAGLISGPAAATAPMGKPSPTGPSASVDDAPARALAHGRELVAILEATESEFNRLPVLVRPLARQGLKSKAGRSLPDWQRSLQLVLQALERFDPGTGQAALPANTHELITELAGLARYFREVPAETARFTRDEAALQDIREISQQRETTVLAFQAALETCLTRTRDVH